MSATVPLQQVRQLIKRVTGQDSSVTVPREFVRFTGDHVSALVLNQILFFSGAFDADDEGWFYRKHEQWEEDICISPFQLRNAVKKLAGCGVETKLRKVGSAPVLHFRINLTTFLKEFSEFLDNQASAQSSRIINKLDNQETSLSDDSENPRKSPIVKKLDNQETSPPIVKELNKPLKDQKNYDPEELSKEEELPHGERAAPRSPVVTVFEYWREVMGHPKAKLTPERDRVIRGRLKDGYTVEEIMQAVDGCRASPFHMGQNEQRKVFDELDVICRNGSKLEGFMALAQTNGGGKPKARAAPAFCTLCAGDGYVVRMNPKTFEDERIPCKCQATTRTQPQPATTRSAVTR